MFKMEKPLKTGDGDENESISPPFEIISSKEASAFIDDLYEKGIRPIVTVPKKYLIYLKEGLRPYTTWIGIPLIAATFGREPYTTISEERVEVLVHGIKREQIKPRFTGPNNAFSGVVVLDPPIPPESISYTS